MCPQYNCTLLQAAALCLQLETALEHGAVNNNQSLHYEVFIDQDQKTQLKFARGFFFFFFFILFAAVTFPVVVVLLYGLGQYIIAPHHF